MIAKIKQFVKIHQSDIILVAGVVLISLLSFAMGYIVAKTQEKEPIRFERINEYRIGCEFTNKITENSYIRNKFVIR